MTSTTFSRISVESLHDVYEQQRKKLKKQIGKDLKVGLVPPLSEETADRYIRASNRYKCNLTNLILIQVGKADVWKEDTPENTEMECSSSDYHEDGGFDADIGGFDDDGDGDVNLDNNGGECHIDKDATSNSEKRDRSNWMAITETLITYLAKSNTVGGKSCSSCDIHTPALFVCKSCLKRPAFCSEHAKDHFKTFRNTQNDSIL